jgi:hypothetical protein
VELDAGVLQGSMRSSVESYVDLKWMSFLQGSIFHSTLQHL